MITEPGDQAMAGKHSSNTEPAKTSRTRSRPSFGNAEPLNHEQERIKKWLKQVRFKKVFFGGVDEADMWKKIAELNSLYEAALSAERARYDALLAEYKSFAVNGKVGDDLYG